nr:uncharacterized protein LOC127328366 [Lolium perenne]
MIAEESPPSRPSRDGDWPHSAFNKETPSTDAAVVARGAKVSLWQHHRHLHSATLNSPTTTPPSRPWSLASTRVIGSPVDQHDSHLPGPLPREPNPGHRETEGTYEDGALRASNADRGAGRPPPPSPETRRGSATGQICHLQPPWLPAATDLRRKWARNGPRGPYPGPKRRRSDAVDHHHAKLPAERGWTGVAPLHAAPGPTRADPVFHRPPWPGFAPPTAEDVPREPPPPRARQVRAVSTPSSKDRIVAPHRTARRPH